MKHKVFADWNLSLEPSPSGDPCDDVFSFDSRVLGREVKVEPTLAHQPDGIGAVAVAAGIKHEGVLDFTVVKLERPGAAAAVFTKNLCAAHAVTYDKEILADGRAQLLAVVSKNAGVFTPTGDQDIRTLAAWLASEFKVDRHDVVLSCTGVIGVPLPMKKLERAVAGLSGKLRPRSLDDVSKAILTTDRGPKVCSVRIGEVVLCGMAKGAGMIEPNMATMLVYFFTNADVEPRRLQAMLDGAVGRTFNSITVDSDTSTSDSVVLFSTCATPVGRDAEADLADALRCMSLKLARDVVTQSEGATKLVECTVSVDTTPRDASLIGKKIVNSPLLKSAVHGGDPNWGRIVMAIGKPDERMELRRLSPGDVTIEMMGEVVFARGAAIPMDPDALSRKIRESARVAIAVRIGEGKHSAKVWGCDLSAKYVEINAEYMT
ncbi:MAG TPA: bifunctional glutamate N-acetyltransferase/amino-acid acetyltransferase ArgJ [Polyangiaceae bacterium]|jgi:glutamate N-acetyltransferase/amino-acid N-acetyltransferase